jgi:hypothetical protein
LGLACRMSTHMYSRRRTVPKLNRAPLPQTSEVFPFQFLVAMLCSRLRHEQDNIIAFLREEKRVLKARLEGRRLRLMIPSGAASPNWGTGLGVGRLGGSRPLRRPTPFFDGIACWWFGWRQRIPRGATRGSRVP